MLGCGKVDMLRAKAGEDFLDLCEAFFGCSMLDDHLEKGISLEVRPALLEERTRGCPLESMFGPCKE